MSPGGLLHRLKVDYSLTMTEDHQVSNAPLVRTRFVIAYYLYQGAMTIGIGVAVIALLAQTTNEQFRLVLLMLLLFTILGMFGLVALLRKILKERQSSGASWVRVGYEVGVKTLNAKRASPPLVFTGKRSRAVTAWIPPVFLFVTALASAVPLIVTLARIPKLTVVAMASSAFLVLPLGVLTAAVALIRSCKATAKEDGITLTEALFQWQDRWFRQGGLRRNLRMRIASGRGARMLWNGALGFAAIGFLVFDVQEMIWRVPPNMFTVIDLMTWGVIIVVPLHILEELAFGYSLRVTTEPLEKG